jgi:hypothetical protein
LSIFEASVRALAQEADLDVTFMASPDHTDPFGQPVSIGLKPRVHIEPLGDVTLIILLAPEDPAAEPGAHARSPWRRRTFG